MTGRKNNNNNNNNNWARDRTRNAAHLLEQKILPTTKQTETFAFMKKLSHLKCRYFYTPLLVYIFELVCKQMFNARTGCDFNRKIESAEIN